MSKMIVKNKMWLVGMNLCRNSLIINKIYNKEVYVQSKPRKDWSHNKLEICVILGDA